MPGASWTPSAASTTARRGSAALLPSRTRSPGADWRWRSRWARRRSSSASDSRAWPQVSPGSFSSSFRSVICFCADRACTGSGCSTCRCSGLPLPLASPSGRASQRAPRSPRSACSISSPRNCATSNGGPTTRSIQPRWISLPGARASRRTSRSSCTGAEISPPPRRLERQRVALPGLDLRQQLAPQERPRAVEAGLHRGGLDVEARGGLLDGQLLYLPEDEHGPEVLGERVDGAPEKPAVLYVRGILLGRSRLGGHVRFLLAGHCAQSAPPPAERFIDGDARQPGDERRAVLEV